MRIKATGLLPLAALGLMITACDKPPVPAAPSPPPASTTEAPADAAAALPPRVTSPAGARVEILSPKDGDIVSSPVKVVFGLEGMTLAPAGDATPDSGHHHLLVDVAAPDLGQPIPKDAQHLHFGQAQSEADVTLAPGQHTLQLLLGDTNHVPHDPPLISAPVTITVQ